MGDSLEAVSYLARSENRVATLRALDAGPRDRRALEAEVGVSRSTLSRVLRELEEERGWIQRTGDTFETTTAGTIVIDRLDSLLETIGGLQTLGDGLAYLPVAEMDLDIRHFHGAELLQPQEFEPTATFEYGIDRMRGSTTVRSVSRTVPTPYVRALHEEVLAGDLTAEIVVDEEYLDLVEGSELAPLWDDVAAAENIRLYGEVIPYRLLVLDEVVHMWLCSDQGDQVGLLETENPTVREWARTLVDRYLADAEPITQRLHASSTQSST